MYTYFFAQTPMQPPSVNACCLRYGNPYVLVRWHLSINSSPPGLNGRHFADDIYGCIFVNEKFCILIEISLNFVPKGPIYNNPARV